MDRAQWVRRFNAERSRLAAIDVAAATCPKCGCAAFAHAGRYRRCRGCDQIVVMRSEYAVEACSIPRDQDGGDPELAAQNERSLYRFVVEAVDDPIPEYLTDNTDNPRDWSGVLFVVLLGLLLVVWWCLL